MPAEDLVLADENIGVAVTREIDEFKIGIVPPQIGQRGEGHKGLPALVFGALVEARGGPFELDQIHLAVAG